MLVLISAVVGLLAVLSNRLSERIHVPAPALFLVAAAVAIRLFPDLHSPPEQLVERVVTVALLCILFDGGMHLGWSRFRRSAAPIAVIGVAGTFLTAAAAAVLAHWAFGLDWYLAALLGTAVSPTDPAVVFSVLGRREVAGRSGDILEGESGANDPVGIALMVALLAAGGITAGSVLAVAGEFVLQMSVGLLPVWSAGVPCCGSCGGSRCPPRACTRCAPWPARSSSTVPRAWRTARVSWRCSSPGSSWATPGHRSNGKSNGSTPRWPASPRSSRS